MLKKPLYKQGDEIRIAKNPKTLLTLLADFNDI